MKILVVSQYFYPENFRVNDLVCGLIERGHEVTVLTGQPNYPHGKFFSGYGWFGPREEKILNAHVIRVPLVARGNGRALRLILNYLSFVFFACLGVIFRLRNSFDVVFVFQVSPVTVGFPTILAGKKFKAPVLFWVLDLWPDSLKAVNALRSPVLLCAVDKMVSWIYARCAKVLISSKNFMEDIVQHGKSDRDVLYFPNWIEPEYESMLSLRAQAKQSSSNTLDGHGACDSRHDNKNNFQIVYAGNIGDAQDFPNILNAIEEVKALNSKVHWIIAGDGRLHDWVFQQVDKRGLKNGVTFLGQLPSSKIHALFASADALLVSLKSDPVFNKTVPGKVQSYLAAGKPILGMLDGEGAQIIEDAKAGFVAPAGNFKRLVQNIKKLIDLSATEKQHLGENGQQYAQKHFERELLFTRLEYWMQEAIQKKREMRCQ